MASRVWRRICSRVHSSAYWRMGLLPINKAASIGTPVSCETSAMGRMSTIMVRAAQLGRMRIRRLEISRQSASTASRWRAPAPGNPTSRVSIPRFSMRWRISTFAAAGGSVTEGLCRPSRSVSSSSMTWAGQEVVRGPARAQSKMRPFSAEISMLHSLVLPASFGCRRAQLAKLTRSPQKLFCSGVITLRTTDHRKVEETAEFVNPLFQAPFEFPASDLGLAFALVNHTQVIVGHYVFGCERCRKLKVLACPGELSLVKQRQRQPVVGGVVVGINVETAAEGIRCLRHIAAVVVGDPEIVIGQHKCRRGRHRAAIVFDGQVQQTFVEQKVSELVVAQDVIGLGIEQVLELLPSLPPPSLPFMYQEIGRASCRGRVTM